MTSPLKQNRFLLSLKNQLWKGGSESKEEGKMIKVFPQVTYIWLTQSLPERFSIASDKREEVSPPALILLPAQQVWPPHKHGKVATSYFLPAGVPATPLWPVQVGTPDAAPRHRCRESRSALRASWATRLASASTST